MEKPSASTSRERSPPTLLREAAGAAALRQLTEAAVPNEMQALVDELIRDKLISAPPSLKPNQWKNISALADNFATQGPNPSARHIRRKLAVYHMINDAQSANR